jgi:hypothetical protein
MYICLNHKANYMKRPALLIITIIILLIVNVKSGYSQLKSIIHDFEGIDIGKKPIQFWETGGLSTQVVNNPATKGPMLGSNVFKITSNGAGTFGKDAYHMVELNVTNDYLNFYFYNPLSNGVNAKFNVILEDDDDHDGKYTAGIDDQWTYPVDIAPGSDWQLITIPLKSFKITGSTKGIFDVGYTFNSKILGFWFQYSDMGANKTFYMDMWSLSEGPLATGNTIFDLPNAAPTDQCMLGTFNSANNIWYPTNISDEAESSLNSPISLNDPGVQKKLCMVHWFIHFSDNQLSPNNFPGNEVQEIINNGYTPMITWEPMYVLNGNLAGAPSLADINNGQMDAYINQFADKIKTYTGTVMIRLMHEPNGNWYPWSVANNNGDTLAYKNAYRRFVNIFTTKGVTNVKWVWCVFYNTYPETQANWFANCYPGDKYVDCRNRYIQ